MHTTSKLIEKANNIYCCVLVIILSFSVWLSLSVTLGIFPTRSKFWPSGYQTSCPREPSVHVDCVHEPPTFWNMIWLLMILCCVSCAS